MRDTPRTDAAQREGLLRGNPTPTFVTTAEFARQLERELDAAKAKLKEAYDDLLNIATMPEYDQDDCHRLRNRGMKGASNLQAFIK